MIREQQKDNELLTIRALMSVVRRYVLEARVAKATESVSVDASLTPLDNPVSLSGTSSTNPEGLAGLVGEAEPNAGYQSGLCGVPQFAPQQGLSDPCNSTPWVVSGRYDCPLAQSRIDMRLDGWTLTSERHEPMSCLSLTYSKNDRYMRQTWSKEDGASHWSLLFFVEGRFPPPPWHDRSPAVCATSPTSR